MRILKIFSHHSWFGSVECLGKVFMDDSGFKETSCSVLNKLDRDFLFGPSSIIPFEFRLGMHWVSIKQLET